MFIRFPVYSWGCLLPEFLRVGRVAGLRSPFLACTMVGFSESKLGFSGDAGFGSGLRAWKLSFVGLRLGFRKSR